MRMSDWVCWPTKYLGWDADLCGPAEPVVVEARVSPWDASVGLVASATLLVGVVWLLVRFGTAVRWWAVRRRIPFAAAFGVFSALVGGLFLERSLMAGLGSLPDGFTQLVGALTAGLLAIGFCIWHRNRLPGLQDQAKQSD
ncbi:hypothetical protein E3G45_005029 [Mycobacteroides abscessus]|nr:hypothetical protein [Mycobacteroides abscessus]